MKVLYDYLKEHDIGHEFTIHDVCPTAASDKHIYYQITSAVTRFCKPSKKNPIPPLRKIGRGKYYYNIAISGVGRKPKTDESLKARKAAKKDIKREIDIESPEQPDSRSLHDELSKLRVSKGILDLMCNNKITFQVKFTCSNVERNFQDEVVRFTIESIDVSVANID
jgi:hypothetical protein